MQEPTELDAVFREHVKRVRGSVALLNQMFSLHFVTQLSADNGHHLG